MNRQDKINFLIEHGWVQSGSGDLWLDESENYINPEYIGISMDSAISQIMESEHLREVKTV